MEVYRLFLNLSHCQLGRRDSSPGTKGGASRAHRFGQGAIKRFKCFQGFFHGQLVPIYSILVTPVFFFIVRR